MSSCPNLNLPKDFTFLTKTGKPKSETRCLVTGGCGYFGSELSKSLHSLGYDVTIVDIQLSPLMKKILDHRLHFVKTDITDYSLVSKACVGIDYVFHAASFGLSGKTQLDPVLTHKINVEGTENIIKACQEQGVGQLVYTSSYNVVMTGQHINNGTEKQPYVEESKVVDYYTLTKVKADKMVLAANGTQVAGGGTLRSCCIRPPGIYGEEERRHFDRVLDTILLKMHVMKWGNAIIDWIHVDNLVQAHLLAARALSPEYKYSSAGQSYFVSDNKPLPAFDSYIGKFMVHMGLEPPRYTMPLFLAYFFSILLELVYHISKPIYPISPLVTRCETLKLYVNHYHNIKKAITELEYNPKQVDFDKIASYYLQRHYHPNQKDSNSNVQLSVVWQTLKLLAIAVLCALFLLD